MRNRRTFLRNAVTLLAVGSFSSKVISQDLTSDFIIRTPLDGVSKRMAEFAQVGPYPLPKGPHLFNGDMARYYFFIPKGKKKLRLVVFSHGTLSDPLVYHDLLFHFASHGFIVAAPVHDDAILESGPTLRQATSGSTAQWQVAPLLEDPQNWASRVDRCIECIGIADEISQTSDFEIVKDRVIMAGHGYGAYITQLIMGAEVSASNGKKLTFRDPRFFAGISLSTQGPGIMGLDENSWKNVTSPMLHILSEGEDDFTGQDWEQRALAFKLSPRGYKHMALINKGGANLFTQPDDSTISNRLTGYLCAKAISACFLRAYGDYEESAFSDLTSDFFQRNSQGHLQEFRL